ncbi:hypothetical protein COLO4_03892 [Corchorus olitorius]|uniref:Uncharacterized protein n=1 Tax=Corchorus olitorius TaxID=93759 RepID=A0A1R3KW43_9ROSI|nr:hypothetical protein COLO4_03892 [Corchorus olitorius]
MTVNVFKPGLEASPILRPPHPLPLRIGQNSGNP